VARAGGWISATQASHTLFISAKSAMSASQICAISICAFELPAAASSRSISASTALVCSATVAPSSHWPAR
jgi:hypothetical protein